MYSWTYPPGLESPWYFRDYPKCSSLQPQRERNVVFWDQRSFLGLNSAFIASLLWPLLFLCSDCGPLYAIWSICLALVWLLSVRSVTVQPLSCYLWKDRNLSRVIIFILQCLHYRARLFVFVAKCCISFTTIRLFILPLVHARLLYQWMKDRLSVPYEICYHRDKSQKFLK